MNTYEARQQARHVRLEAAADRADARATQAFDKADMREEKSGIPFGQPILVGHHSEGKHRRAIARADSAMRQGIEESKHAASLRAKAAGVGTGGISSDDPDAIGKLKEKLDRLSETQRIMVESNKVLRCHVRCGLTPETHGAAWSAYVNDLASVKPSYEDNTARALVTPDCCGRIGYADYQLSNNRAEIKRLEQRIRQLERSAERETKERDAGFCRVIENAQENRLQLAFEGKPDAAVRAILKRGGFRWSPRNGAWQRQLTRNALWSLAHTLSEIEAMQQKP